MKIKILDRYIFTKFVTSFLFVVLALTAVIVVIDFTEKNDDFIRSQPGIKKIVFTYFFNFIPYITNMLSPITVFIATVFVTARLASRTEIIAILNSGVSFVRFLVPYIAGSSIIGLCIFGLNSFIIPHSNAKRVGFELQYLKQKFNYEARNVHIKVAPETYAYLESYNNQADIGYQFSLETIRDGALVSKLKSERIAWVAAKGKWRVEDYSLRQIDSNGKETYTKGVSVDTTLRILPKDFASTYLLYETLSTPELNAHISEMEARGADDIMPYRIEKYLRLTYPFAILILTLIGVILSARKTREGAGFQIALGFALAFIYIIFFIMSRSIAQAGSIEPLLACWLPNIVFSCIGLVLYKTVPR